MDRETSWSRSMMSSDKASRTATGTTTPVGAQDQLWRNRNRRPLPDERLTCQFAWSRLGESNPGPTHYECVALTD